MNKDMLFKILILLLIFIHKVNMLFAQETNQQNNLEQENIQQNNWEYVFNNYFLSSVENTPWGLLVGEYDSRAWLNPFNGIYKYDENTNSFKEFNLKDKGVTNILLDNDYNIYTTTYYHTNTPAGLFVSIDKGKTFNHIGPPYSSNIVSKIDGVIFLGTYAHGLYVSYDEGLTWEQKISNIFIENIEKVGNEIFIYGYKDTYKYNKNLNEFSKIDFKKNTINFNINDFYKVKADEVDVYVNDIPTKLYKYTKDITYDFDLNYNLYSIVNGYGLYKYVLPKNELNIDNKFSIPFEYQDKNELLDKITAYFDHQYPLLGLGINESNENNKTTLNFLGEENEEPYLYYSSHNGTDYALSYGSKIIAVDNGYARYFWCYACGHSIEITHENGYKSIYMHLQEDILINKDGSEYVYKNQHIANVGMSGNTTGPHLHLSIKKDNIVIDPYGWQHNYLKDPWENYEKDYIKGNKSVFLWEHNLNTEVQKELEEDKITYINDNLKVKIDTSMNETKFVPKIHKYIKPSTNNQKNLNYVSNSSNLISIYNSFGKKIPTIDNFIDLEFNIPIEYLNKNISIWHYDKLDKKWETIESEINKELLSITAKVNSFSHFAIFENTYVDINNFFDKAKVNNTQFNIGYF